MLGVAILSYGWVIDTSTSATAMAKALVFTGSDVAATLSREVAIPEISQPSTVVERIEGTATMLPSTTSVEVLGIDRGTFADAAFWDESFAPLSLADLLRLLSQTRESSLRAVALADGFDGSSALALGEYRIPLDVVARVDAFPGMRMGRGLLVVDRDALDAALTDAGTSAITAEASQEIWIKGDPALIGEELSDTPLRLVTAAEVRQSQGFLPLSWTFGLVRGLGILTFGLAIAALFVYLAMVQRARQVADALTRRMGLSRVDARRAAVLEVGALLVFATAIGIVLAACTSLLIYGRIDPLPAIPPSPILRIPGMRLILLALLAMAGSAVAGRYLEWVARRGKVAELMRYAQ